VNLCHVSLRDPVFHCTILCIAQTMLLQDIRLSVHTSHASIVSTHLNVSSNFFLPLRSHTVPASVVLLVALATVIGEPGFEAQAGPIIVSGLLLLVCVSFTIIGQPRNSVLIRRV